MKLFINIKIPSEKICFSYIFLKLNTDLSVG